jgi:hypothetical protein
MYNILLLIISLYTDINIFIYIIFILFFFWLLIYKLWPLSKFKSRVIKMDSSSPRFKIGIWDLNRESIRRIIIHLELNLEYEIWIERGIDG